MLVQTLGKWVGLGLLLASVSHPLKAKELPATNEPIKVSVYDDAGVGLELLIKSEKVASDVFERARVEIRWLNCGIDGKLTGLPGCGKAEFPTRLQLRMLKRSRGLTAETFGISYLSSSGEGVYSQIFVEPVELLHGTTAMSISDLLGHVAAHELAHLLLGTNSHSADGLMRARWGAKELERVNQGTLLFDHEEAHKMAERLIAGAKRNAEVQMAAAATDAPQCSSQVAAGATGIASGTD
jgi:hypothetical protein